VSRSEARVGGFELAAVATLLVVGAGLRFWRLDLGWFGVDQARDIQTALDIAAGQDWPTVGPTMRRITSLGALYHYFWALPHLLSEDPLAAYRFAAGLGVVTLLLAWGFARGSWGRRAGLVTLAILATSPLAVIDGRVAWAPAALPVVAMVVLWLLVGKPTAWRLGALGAVLGIAIQLHLTMVAWGAAALLLVVGSRPPWRGLAAAALACAVIGFPAAYAALTNAGQDAGLATLPTRGPLPDVPARLAAALALGWRVPSAFWQWSDAPEPWPLLARAAGVLLAGVGVLGLARLAVAARGRARPAIVVLTVLGCQLAMVALLPGEVWYYYLDAALPLWALAAGACVAPTQAEAAGGRRRALDVTAAIVMAAALALGGRGARWLGESARHDYLMLNPAGLTLDGASGRDAAVPGRLVAAGVKRAVAATIAVEPVPFATRWLATHGPAFDDATGDNGFWLFHASSEAAAAGPVTHAALWYRDDPAAPTRPVPGFELVTVGPLVVARYRTTIAYDACRDEHGPVVVPVRVVPHPRRYGDGTMARAATLPSRIDCVLAAGGGATRVVAAVSAGTVTLRDATGTRSPAARESTLCIRRGAQPAPVAIEVALPAGTAADLDLYERPDPDCAAEKIAP
jgi:hypothetical protein